MANCQLPVVVRRDGVVDPGLLFLVTLRSTSLHPGIYFLRRVFMGREYENCQPQSTEITNICAILLTLVQYFLQGRSYDYHFDRMNNTGDIY